MRLLILGVALLMAGCGNENVDMNGRELRSAERMALATCNSWLRNKLRGTLGEIDPNKAVFEQKGNRLEVSWLIESKVGTGGGMCATNDVGTEVVGAVIDGLEVQP